MLPDGVKIVGQKAVIVDWPAYVKWHKANGTFKIPKVNIAKSPY